MARVRPRPGSVIYPDEDDQVPESNKHVEQLALLLTVLQAYFRERPDVFVGGNSFLYYQEGDPARRLSPDIYVAFGVRPRPIEKRGSYRLWEEGVVPAVVVELTSGSTRRVDTVQKVRQYAALGVQEYYLFDPLGEYLRPPLQGYRLNEQGQYDRLPGEELTSPALGLRLVVRDGWLRLLDPATGRLLPTLDEVAVERAAAEAEITRLRAELARLRASADES